MDIEILRGEIERLFSLDELTALSRDLLGARSGRDRRHQRQSFLRARAHRSMLAARRPRRARRSGDRLAHRRRSAASRPEPARIFVDETPRRAAMAGPFVVNRRIGEGAAGHRVRAEHGAQRDPEGAPPRSRAGRQSAHRFLTVSRLIGRVGIRGLPARPRGRAPGRDRRLLRRLRRHRGRDRSPRASGATAPMHIQEARRSCAACSTPSPPCTSAASRTAT